MTLLFGCGDDDEEAKKDHDKNIIGALQRAREVGLRFNASKFQFRTSMSYCGHAFTAAGLLPDP